MFCAFNFNNITLANLGINTGRFSGDGELDSALVTYQSLGRRLVEAGALTQADLRAEKALALPVMRAAKELGQGKMRGVATDRVLLDPARLFRARQSAVDAQFGTPFRDFVSLAKPWAAR